MFDRHELRRATKPHSKLGHIESAAQMISETTKSERQRRVQQSHGCRSSSSSPARNSFASLLTKELRVTVPRIRGRHHPAQSTDGLHLAQWIRLQPTYTRTIDLLLLLTGHLNKGAITSSVRVGRLTLASSAVDRYQ